MNVNAIIIGIILLYILIILIKIKSLTWRRHTKRNMSKEEIDNILKMSGINTSSKDCKVIKSVVKTKSKITPKIVRNTGQIINNEIQKQGITVVVKNGEVIAKDERGNIIEGVTEENVNDIIEKLQKSSLSDSQIEIKTKEQINEDLEKIKEDIRMEAKSLMEDNPVKISEEENAIDEMVICEDYEDDGDGITRY